MGKAKRVSPFKVLRRELGRQLAANGFGEVPQDASSRNHILLYFSQESHVRRFGFWFQRNVKSLYVDALGSSFTLESFRSLEDPFKAGGGRERFYFLLTPAEREEMRAIQNHVINRLPPLEESSLLRGKWSLLARSLRNNGRLSKSHLIRHRRSGCDTGMRRTS